MARVLETSAGSESTARAEREALGTWEIHRGLGRTLIEYADRMDHPEGGKCHGGSRTRW